MSGRERILAITVAGALGLGAAYKLGRWLVVAPIQSLNARIASLAKSSSDLSAALKRDNAAPAQWKELAGQSLAGDANVAQRRMREDLQALMEQHHLTDATITPRPTRAVFSFEEVKVNLRADGSLRDIVGFLCDFYRRNYLCKIDSIQLNAEELPPERPARVVPASTPPAGGREPAESGGRRRNGRRGGIEAAPPAATPPPAAAAPPAGRRPRGAERKLTLNVTASALVLHDPNVDPVETVETLPQGRLSEPPEAYASIYEKNIFSEYVPPPPPAPAVASRPQTQPEPHEPVVAEHHQPPPRQPDMDKRLIATTGFGGSLVAIVEDEKKKTEAPARLELNDALAGGTIILIHPRGVVVRSERGDETRDVFYPLGAKFNEGVNLEDVEYPEVVEEVQKAMQHS